MKIEKCASRWSLLLNAGLKLTCKSKEFMAVAFFWPREAPATCTVHLHLQATLKQMYEHQRRHEKRGPQLKKTACLFFFNLSCLALVVVFMSSAFCSTDSEKREKQIVVYFLVS